MTIDYRTFSLNQWDEFDLGQWDTFLLDPAQTTGAVWRIEQADSYQPGAGDGETFTAGTEKGQTI